MSTEKENEKNNYNKKMREFQNISAAIKEMEKCFSPDLAEDYINTKKKRLLLLVELLESGINYTANNEIISIRIENSTYTIPRKDVKATIYEKLSKPSTQHGLNPDFVKLISCIAPAMGVSDFVQNHQDNTLVSSDNNSEFLQLKKDFEKITNENYSLKEENEKLKKLAFLHTKTGAKNSNSFNFDFPKMKLESLILAIVGIQNMKSINDTYGRDCGDRVIISTCNTICDNFDKSNVYCIMGDQFLITVLNSDYETVQSKLLSVKDKLFENNMNIVYGLASGDSYSNHSELLAAAEKNMKEAKNAPISEYNTDSNQKIETTNQDDIEFAESENSVPTSTGAEEVNVDEMLQRAMSDY